MQVYWFIALLCSICLEGLGRKYLPEIPSVVFYFLKDVVLLSGFFVMRTSYEVRRSARWLISGFTPVIVGGIVWTVLEMFNPSQESLPLGLLGLRAYWLWWLAPVLVATSLRDPRAKQKAIWALVIMSLAICILAAVQFASPPTSEVNLYSTVDGEQVFADRATVAATGRARVSSTFSFVSGFASFTILVPALLLSLGLEVRSRKLRRASLLVTLVCAAVVPMSGSRGSIVVGVAVLIISTWTAGLLFTAIGRRVLVGAVVAVVVASAAFPDAILGVQSRFEGGDTEGRFLETLTVLPPVALMTFDYPVMGIGTGMQQNARASMGVRSAEYAAEGELGRYLIELGPVGFMLIWTARLGLAIGLYRAHRLLKRAGRRGAAGAALSYAVLAMIGNPAFDHVFQALFFMGCGFLLNEVAEVETQSVGTLAAQALAPAAERR